MISPGEACLTLLPFKITFIDLGIEPALSWSDVYWIFNYWNDLNFECPAKNVNFPLTLFYWHFFDIHWSRGL